jgi:protein-tyrosine phosphatase
VVRVCFVCLGNICRSPTAEGIFRRLVEEAGLEEEIAVESAGTGAWHVGELPDPRSRATAFARGVRLESRGRQLEAADLARLDYVLAMDGANLSAVRALARRVPPTGVVTKLLAFHPDHRAQDDVPDPYAGGVQGFDHVFDLCEAACRGLLRHIRKQHGLDRAGRT